MTRIETFSELIDYLNTHDLTPAKFNEIVAKSVGCYLDESLPKHEKINHLKTYFEQWQDTPLQDRPLFAN